MAQELREAIKNDDVALFGQKFCKYLLEGGSMTDPLFDTCRHGSIKCLRELLRLMRYWVQEGKQDDDYNAIHLSLVSGHVEIAKELAKAVPSLCLQRDKHSRTPLHMAAEMEGLSEVVKVFVMACPESLELKTSDGETALHLAVKNGNCDSLTVMMEQLPMPKMKKVLGLKDCGGNTVLHIAVQKKSLEIILTLLQSKNCPPGLVDVRNSNGQTPLDLVNHSDSDSIEKHISVLLHDAKSKEGAFSHNGSAQPSHSPPLRPEPTISDPLEFMTKKNALLGVFILIATVTFECVFSLNNIYPVEHHVEIIVVSVGDLILDPDLLPDGFVFMVSITAAFSTSIFVIVVTIWSFGETSSFRYRALPLFVTVMIFISYALVLNKIMPKFWVTFGRFRISSFWFMWLSHLPLIFATVTVWFMGKYIPCILETKFSRNMMPKEEEEKREGEEKEEEEKREGEEKEKKKKRALEITHQGH